MSGTAASVQPRTFPPKMFFLIIWMMTLFISLCGLLVTPPYEISIYVWLTIAAIAFWQVWTIRWVEIDNTGIQVRNVFRRRRGLRWEEITRFHEEEIHLNRGSYIQIFLSNEGADTVARPTRINLTSDQQGFDALRVIIQANRAA